MACFDEDATIEVIERVAKAKPLCAVFRDAFLASDVTAANSEELFKTYNPDIIRRVTLTGELLRCGDDVRTIKQTILQSQYEAGKGGQLPSAGALLLHGWIHLGNQSQTFEAVLLGLGATGLPAVIRQSRVTN